MDRTDAIAVAACLGVAAMLTGCAGQTRKTLTPAELQTRDQADLTEMASQFHTGAGKLINRMEAKYAAAGGEAPTINILAMSGGGDYGAFGAGFLRGWGNVTEPGFKRPEFDVVTGVSTGAMLAPFAFVGTEAAYAEVDDFYRNPKKDWTDDRGILFFWPSNPSFETIPGLTRDVRGAIDKQFVAEMAERSRNNKLLLVGSTNLDYGRQRMFEVGEIAEEADRKGEPELVSTVMLASAAIPVVFPPIQIDDQLYCDGGVTANVLLKLDPKNPNAVLPRWHAAHPDKPLPRVRYWIIINNQLAHIPKTVQPKWTDVAGPALEVAIRSATLAEVKWLAAEADYVNAVYGTDVEVRMVGIPDDWRPPVEGTFQKETMVSLSDLGRKLGDDPSSWMLMTAPVRSKAGAATGH